MFTSFAEYAPFRLSWCFFLFQTWTITFHCCSLGLTLSCTCQPLEVSLSSPPMQSCVLSQSCSAATQRGLFSFITWRLAVSLLCIGLMWHLFPWWPLPPPRPIRMCLRTKVMRMKTVRWRLTQQTFPHHQKNWKAYWQTSNIPKQKYSEGIIHIY